MTDFTGQYFDRYHILEALGEGGMASVYKAYDTRLERDVAVKIIRTDMFIPATLQQVLKRFEREAKSLGKLSHPNIVNIIDYGEHEGVPFLVMEYLPGGTLKDRLKGQPLPWQDSIHLLIPIAHALQFSHQQGIIHRDVKPSNILITLSGEPMLSDFGIAKILESKGSTTLTGTGVGIGTPEYMAPEQWLGKTSPQTDIYSLGVVLYEMVTGKKPYTADTPTAVLLKQANEPLRRPRQIVPDLPDRIEKVILKALAKKSEARYQSMEEFSTALETLLGGPAETKQTTFPWKRVKAEISPQPEQVAPLEQKPIGDQPTLDAGLPAKIQPIEPVSQAAESTKTVISPPVAPAHALEIPYPPFAEPVEKHDIAQPSFPLLRRIKIRPAGIIVTAGFLVVIVLSVLLVVLFRSGPTPGPVAGRYVYFTSNENDWVEVYYLSPLGIKKQVTHTPAPYESWSPFVAANGFVYFTSNESGRAEVYYLSPQGIKKQVTHTPAPYASWSPVVAANGFIYFTSNEGGRAEVYYLNPQGIKKQVTHTPTPHESWITLSVPNSQWIGQFP